MSEGPKIDPKSHPESGALERFMRGESLSPENAEVLTHLLAGCPHCRKVTREAWRRGRGLGLTAGGAPEVHPSSYAELWPRVRKARRIHEKLLAADRKSARRLCRELIELPARERLPRVCEDERFANLHLVRRLTGESLWHRPDTPPEALELAEVAVAVAERLDPRTFCETTVRDLRAGAWGALGTAHRRLGDPDSAERALVVAGLHLRAGSGDPLERARLLLLEAALCRHRHRLPEALARVRRAESSHGGLGDEALLGRILLERGRIYRCLGDLETAVETSRRGLRRLHPEHHAREIFDTRVAIGHLLMDLGRTARALLELRAVGTGAGPSVDDGPEPRVARREIPPHLLELRRLEGRIALARGDHALAERRLSEVWRQCLRRRESREAMRAALHLADLYRRHDPEKLRRFRDDLSEIGWSGLDPAERPCLDLLCSVTEDPVRPTGLLPLLAGHLEGRPAVPGMRITSAEAPAPE